MAGGTRPELVLVCMRNTLDSSLSNVRDRFSNQTDALADRADALTDYGFLFETLSDLGMMSGILQSRCAQRI